MELSRHVLKRAIEQVGVKTVAKSLNLSPALLYRWCEAHPEDPQAEAAASINPLDRVRSIFDATQDMALINWICKAAGGFFVKDPTARRTVRNQEMFKQTQALIKEFSNTLNAIAQAYSDDNITAQEAERIRVEWERLKQAGETLVRECETGFFNPEHPGKKHSKKPKEKKR
jgi:hypothetical protein